MKAHVIVADEASITAPGERVGSVGHVVSTASARARGWVADLDRRSLDTKVIGRSCWPNTWAAA
jgi:hypothetical protein